MIIVGELINASRKVVTAAIENKDTKAIQQLAIEQAENGANYIDVNAGTFVGREAEYLTWLVETVQAVVDIPCCIDSPDPGAIQAALAVHKGTPMINSISLESKRFNTLVPIVAGTDFKVIALCMSDDGMPETVEDRLTIADKLVNGLTQKNINLNQIYVDPLVQPVSTNKEFGIEFLKSVEQVITIYEGIHTMCGLSNISYGLPNRAFINQTFMSMAIAKGLDGAIVNPLDKRMMANIMAAEMLAGKGDSCMGYLKAHRAGKFEFTQK